jgi:tetratricopeptide (TPR) repeat protein
VSDHATQPFRYRAFISYSHRDERSAAWLHKALERYRIPRRLVGRPSANGPVPARIAPVFRDREELPTATDLSRIVNTALEQSAALIVICSPPAAASRWVNEEIRAFRRLGRGERIYCLIVAGEPEATGAERCFPPALLEAQGPAGSAATVEPIGADIRPGKDRPQKALLKLVAGLVGVGLDELTRRELQRRNRRLVAISAAALVGMSVASVLAGVAVLARNEADRQRVRAETEAATARQTSEFLVEIFQVVDPGEARGATVTARDILDRGAARIDRDLAEQPVVRANLLLTMGRVYTGLGLYEPAKDMLSRALALRDDLRTAPSVEGVATGNALGAALYLKGEYDAAEEVYAAAWTAAQALYPDGDAAVTEALNGLAALSSQREDFAAAVQRFSEALAIDRRLHGDVHPDVARTLSGLAEAFMYLERYDESEAAFRESLSIRRATLGDDHPLVADTLNNLGTELYFAGRVDEAEPFFREAVQRYRAILGTEHTFVSSIQNNLGRLLLERGDLDGALPVLTEALATDRKLKDPDHDDLIFTLNNLGLVRLGLGHAAEALPLFEEALRIADAHSHRMRGQVLTSLADIYWRIERPADALAAVARARPLIAEDYADEPWREAQLSSVEGAARIVRRELDAAEPLLLDSYAVIEREWGASALFTRLAAERVAALYDARGDAENARRYRAVAAGTAAQSGR